MSVPGLITPGSPSTAPARRGAALGWLAIVAGLVAVGTIGAVLVGGSTWTQRDALDPESAAPDGTRALASILSEQGVQVRVVRSHTRAIAELAAAEATLVLPDAPALSDDALAALTDAAAEVVLIDPRSRSLRLLAPDATAVGVADDALVAPACAVPEAVRAGAIRPRTVYTAGAVAQCYPVAGGAALLVADEVPASSGRTQRISAVDGAALFTNAHLGEDGNAALALGLLGHRQTLIWYVPSVADSDLAPLAPSLGELTPPWVSPVAVVLLAAALAAALWRGIRFGPLVSERLPVTVRGDETTRGRAHLYERSGDLAHAALLLRRGTRTRIARLLGLSGSAPADDVADALCTLTGHAREDVHDVLAGRTPTTRRELDELHHRLQALERDARTGLHSERNDR